MYLPTLPNNNPPAKLLSLANKLSQLNPSGTFFWLLMGESRSGLSLEWSILYVDACGQIRSATQLTPDSDPSYPLAKILGGRLKTTEQVYLPVCVLPANQSALLAAKRMLNQMGVWVGDEETFVSREVG